MNLRLYKLKEYYQYINDILYAFNTQYHFYGNNTYAISDSYKGIENVISLYYNYGKKQQLIPQKITFHLFFIDIITVNNYTKINHSITLKYYDFNHDNDQKILLRNRIIKANKNFRKRKKYIKNICTKKRAIFIKRTLPYKTKKYKPKYSEKTNFSKNIKKLTNKAFRKNHKDFLDWDNYQESYKESFINKKFFDRN